MTWIAAWKTVWRDMWVNPYGVIDPPPAVAELTADDSITFLTADDGLTVLTNA